MTCSALSFWPVQRLKLVFGVVLLLLMVRVGAGTVQNGVLATKEYRDSRGFFAILPPANWKVQDYPDDPRGKVAFLAPDNHVAFRILARIADVDGFDDLVSKTEAQAHELRRRWAARVTTSRGSLGGGPAVTVEAELLQENETQKLVMINFLRGNVLHNFTFGGPESGYTQYWPIVKASMETYQPLARDVASDEIIRHAVAAKKRRAELDIARGDFENALRMVNEGLELDPLDPTLIAMKERILEEGHRP